MYPAGMTTPSTAEDATADPDLTAAGVLWDLDTLLEGADTDELLDRAEVIVDELAASRGTIGDLDTAQLAALMARSAELEELLGRIGNYVMLRFSEDTADPERGAAMMAVEERATTMSTKLVFFELEWAELPDERVEELLADPRLDFCAHHLRNLRRYRPHLLSEPEEKLLTEKSVSGAGAWVRLFDELISALTVKLPASLVDQPGEAPVEVPFEAGLSLLQHPDRDARSTAATAVTESLAPGLRTRAFVYNTLLLDKSVDDRLRSYPDWVSSRNLANEATDESVQALIDAVVGRYDIAHRWYSAKAKVLGLERLADYDRMASVADDESSVGWTEARRVVLDAYGSFSPELADVAGRFFEENWIDAPTGDGKRPGAFCAYTVPSHHPYVLLNWTGRSRDVLTLAHELGHGLHAYLARDQGVFHQSTPLTLAETASVFGEAVTNTAMLDAMTDPGDRFSLLAATLEGSIATVFRQVAMNRFEDAAHRERREVGELSVERLGELWGETQGAVLGHAVELTEGYRTWWSYIPHFIGSPGYVYAYAYGQLLALSVYARYRTQGDDFVPAYLDLLRAGGSLPPEELGRMVDCDLTDPAFWDSGLDIVEAQLDATIGAAHQAGRLD